MVKQIKNSVMESLLIVISLFIFSYLLNFLWESFHSVFLYNGHNFDSIKYVPMIGYASMIDGVLIVGSYILASLLWKNLFWLKEKNIKAFILFALISILVGGFIEYHAVFLLDRWSYNSLMPTLFGIGLSPLLQLGVTGILAVLITRMLLYHRIEEYGR